MEGCTDLQERERCVCMNKYDEYQLQWMLEHGHSLREIINGMADVAKDADSETTIQEIFSVWEQEVGFGGELWACEPEWADNEGDELTEKDLRAFGDSQMRQAEGGTDPESLIHFDYKDQTIVNPFYDPTGRFELSVDGAITAYGMASLRKWSRQVKKAIRGE